MFDILLFTPETGAHRIEKHKEPYLKICGVTVPQILRGESPCVPKGRPVITLVVAILRAIILFLPLSLFSLPLSYSLPLSSPLLYLLPLYVKLYTTSSADTCSKH